VRLRHSEASSDMATQCCSYAWLLLTLLITAEEEVAATRVQQMILDRHVFRDKYFSSALQGITQVKQQRGIIFPCGGAKQLANAYVGSRVIRDYLACDLPIEIAYYGAHEMDAYHKSLFEASSAG